jgi:hypothetical protein
MAYTRQMHAMAEALSYAIASGSKLVVNDSCSWDLRTAEGFWERYMQPVSSCALPPKEALIRPQLIGEADENAQTQDTVLWDTLTSMSPLRIPERARTWCRGAAVWSRSCVPDAFTAYGASWWHAHVRCLVYRFCDLSTCQQYIFAICGHACYQKRLGCLMRSVALAL